MYKEKKAAVFQNGNVLLFNGRLPAPEEARTLPLSDSGSCENLGPAGSMWGRVENCELPPGWTAVNRRDIGKLFGLEAFRFMSTCWGLADWHHQAQYCGVCGTKMVRAQGERAMKCPKCGHMLFPVICPAMIVAVERDGKLLLAKNIQHRTNRFSVLAGFIEVGESIEDAVVREVREEVNIEVDRASIRYQYSQYWPFPRSLMLACRAQWKSGELQPDGSEIIEAHWFAPEEIPLEVPGTVTVAGWLIRDFLKRHGLPRPDDLPGRPEPRGI
jgi:NAD+ diphosphatase